MNTLSHPVLPDIPIHEDCSRPIIHLISLYLLSLLEDWCKPNGAILIPGYEGPGANGTGVAILIPEDWHSDVFLSALIRYMEAHADFSHHLIHGMRSSFGIFANKGKCLVFPNLVVTL